VASIASFAARAVLSGIKGMLDEETKARARGLPGFRHVQHAVNRALFGESLRELAVAYGSTKWGPHGHAAHYERYFAKLRGARLNLLEIGVGGYGDPRKGGESLRMWRTYFPRARIFGIDVCDKRAHDERRIRTFRGSQTDEAFLARVADAIGTIDIIIEDGSGENRDKIRTFELLFPRLALGGIYVIEQVQTSYWTAVGGSSVDLDRADTTMGFLKRRTDGLNHAELELPGYAPTYDDRHIVGMHFHHNIVFIEKGRNDEGSNVITSRRTSA
jgi:hypothetical protein